MKTIEEKGDERRKNGKTKGERILFDKLSIHYTMSIKYREWQKR